LALFVALVLACTAARAQPAVDSAALPVLDTVALQLSDSTVLPLNDSTALLSDTAAVDTTLADDAITDPIFSTGEDSTVNILEEGNRRVLIYGNAKVTYQDMEITGDFMDFDMENKIVFVRGTYDTTTHETKGKPVFKQGEGSYEMDSMYFNFNSKKAKIYTVITQQSDGYLHGESIKRMPDNIIYVKDGKYTTCDAEHPHFYLALTKAKVIPDDKVVVGPSYFVLEDVVVPLGIPFGLFPQSSSRASGVIIPSYGEEARRGFFFRDGGYYLAPSEYFDVALTGSIFTLGSYEFAARSSYLWKYHFSGGFNFNYAYNVVGEKGDADYNPIKTYSIQWTHTQDPKMSPNKTFSASVNFSSSKYNDLNGQSLQQALTSTTSSSISYSQVWPGTPFSLSVAATHSQNNRDTTITLGLPSLNFNMAAITPFKRKERVGAMRWYEQIRIPLSMSLQNSISAKEYEYSDMEFLFKQRMRNGMKYNTSLSLPIPILGFVNITPSVSYNGRVYFSHIDQQWVDTLGVKRDTSYGLSHEFDFATSVSASTRLYGMAQFGAKSYIQAIRHVASPSVSLSWRPDFSTNFWGYYDCVQVDSTGKMERYSRHAGSMNGTAGAGRSASMSFSLGNTLEMKVRDDNDTTGVGSKKIKLLEGLNFSSSYNFLADSMQLAPISFSGRTTLFGTLGINFSGMLNPYAYTTVTNDKGTKTYYNIARWNYKQNGSLVRLTNFNFSFGYSFNRDEKVTNTLPQPIPRELDPMGIYDGLQVRYTDFSLPWSFNVSYSFGYNKTFDVPSIMQTLNFNGNFSLTAKWKFTFSSGYDLAMRKIAPTNVGLTRDLHCWTMNFSWIPIGSWKSWNFSIAVNSAMLQDLKYDRQISRFDQMPIE
jgi:hypothetical protein